MYKHFFKRIIDIGISLVAIIVVFPFMLPIVIGLLLTGEHYVFYSQQRIGRNNQPFKILKFATMLKASPGLGSGSITLKDDWRVTPMGKYLRGSKLNEIPQLINILKGDMSFVGPRPLMQVDLDKFPEDIKATFYHCKPGLTGIASIVFRDEERLFSESGMDPHVFDKQFIAPYKGALELWYQQNISCYTDFMLIFITAWAIFLPTSDLIYKMFKDLPVKPKELQ